MSNRKAALIFVILVTILFFGAYLGQRSQRNITSISSSYSSSPRGLKALYVFLDEFDVRVSRLERSFEFLPDGVHHMLILSEPSRVLISDQDAKHLLNWVNRGNFVIFANRCGEGRFRPELDAALLKELRIRCLADDTWREELEHRRFSLQPARLNLNYAIQAVSAKNLSLRELDVPDGIIVLSRENNPVAAMFQKGRGAILFVASSSILENSEIGRLDNLQFVWNFLLYSGARSILFDEYHHGVQKTFSVHSARRLRVLSWTALQVTALLALFVFVGSGRFGPPRKRLLERGRSATETIESLSLLFLRGRKYQFLCASLQQNLVVSLHKKYHLAKDLSNWNEFAQLHRQRIGVPDELREILEMKFSNSVREKFFHAYSAGVDRWRRKMGL